jgi:hypothetical protein
MESGNEICAIVGQAMEGAGLLLALPAGVDPKAVNDIKAHSLSDCRGHCLLVCANTSLRMGRAAALLCWVSSFFCFFLEPFEYHSQNREAKLVCSTVGPAWCLKVIGIPREPAWDSSSRGWHDTQSIESLAFRKQSSGIFWWRHVTVLLRTGYSHMAKAEGSLKQLSSTAAGWQPRLDVAYIFCRLFHIKRTLTQLFQPSTLSCRLPVHANHLYYDTRFEMTFLS